MSGKNSPILHGHMLSLEAKRCEDFLEFDKAAKLHLAARNDFKVVVQRIKAQRKEKRFVAGDLQYQLLHNGETIEALSI